MTSPFLQSYGGQTTEELLALASKYRIDSLVLAFEQAIEAKANQSPEESVVLAVEALEREVNNGGYWQFFVNSSNAFAATIESALRAINCPKTADITRDAIAVLGTDGDSSPGAVSEAAEGDEARTRLGECDDRYFSNDEPIADRLFEWIEVNKGKIRVGGA
jgi:hypothetical protein